MGNGRLPASSQSRTRPERNPGPVAYQAEYIWLDGVEPTPLLRSKTKIIADGAEPGIWGFDGSSTEQAPGDKSDCVLKPVFVCPDPLRGRDHVLVMAEVHARRREAAPDQHRAACEKVAKKYAKQEPLFGIEQEYTMLKANGRPLGFPDGGLPRPAGAVLLRRRHRPHHGPGHRRGAHAGVHRRRARHQRDQRRGHARPVGVPDRPGGAAARSATSMYVARWLLHRIAEDFDVIISFDAKPEKGDWNGAGAHTNFSTNGDAGRLRVGREGGQGASAPRWELHVKNYGHGIEERLTGKHETAPWNKFSYGVSDRGASVRIPWQVAKDGTGLHRGPAAERQHGSVRGHPADHRDESARRWLERPRERRWRVVPPGDPPR